MYSFVRSPKGFLRVETHDILIADCDFSPYENNPSGYEKHLIEVIKRSSFCFNVASRIYRTHKGLRVIVFNRNIEVKNEGIIFLQSINTDTIYINICRTNNVYSARLSPKPHRIGLAKSAFYNYLKIPKQKQSWFDEYEERCVNYATCKFKQSTQENLIVMPDIRNFLEMHDLKTKAFEDLPLA
jgi:hypothetical protein